jgi:hypothetical protein
MCNKTCQYTTNETKLFFGMKEVSLKDAQRGALQKMITWTKKSKKGRQEWDEAFIKVGLPIQKFINLVKTQFA